MFVVQNWMLLDQTDEFFSHFYLHTNWKGFLGETCISTGGNPLTSMPVQKLFSTAHMFRGGVNKCP